MLCLRMESIEKMMEENLWARTSAALTLKFKNETIWEVYSDVKALVRSQPAAKICSQTFPPREYEEKQKKTVTKIRASPTSGGIEDMENTTQEEYPRKSLFSNCIYDKYANLQLTQTQNINSNVESWHLVWVPSGRRGYVFLLTWRFGVSIPTKGRESG